MNIQTNFLSSVTKIYLSCNKDTTLDQTAIAAFSRVIMIKKKNSQVVVVSTKICVPMKECTNDKQYISAVKKGMHTKERTEKLPPRLAMDHTVSSLEHQIL